MHNPSSFEHVESRYFDDGVNFTVIMKYRGNNAFGAKVLNAVKAKIDIKGNIVQIY